MKTIKMPNISSTVQHKHYCKDSLIHPAKMSPVLAQWIIKNYTKEGELILDPMCGIGTTLVEAVLLGRNAVGVEYEQKFVDLAQRNLDGLKIFKPKGRAIVFQGDSRNLSDIIQEKADCIAFSPPYANTTSGMHYKARGKDIVEKRAEPDIYSEDENNIGNLNYNPQTVDSIVFSPPYADSFNEKKHTASPGGIIGKDKNFAHFEGGYGKGRGNIGNLPYGCADSIIFSPPYANTSLKTGVDLKGRLYGRVVLDKRPFTKQDFRNMLMHEGADFEKGAAYSRDKENLGNLPYGDVDSIIFSPPYADALNLGQEGNPDKKLKKLIDGKQKIPKDKRMPRGSNAYSTDKNNIGNLKHGNIDAVITSPPFAEDNRGGGIYKKRGFDEKEISSNPDNIDNLKYKSADAIVTSPPFESTEPFQDKEFDLRGRGGSKFLEKTYTENRGNSEQIATLKGKNYLTEMLKIYQQCFAVLRNNGLMVLHTKNFVRQGKTVRLDEDTKKLCEHAGFKKTEHIKVKLAGYSFWIRNARKKFYQKNPNKVSGDPHAYFEDLQVFRKVV